MSDTRVNQKIQDLMQQASEEISTQVIEKLTPEGNVTIDEFMAKAHEFLDEMELSGEIDPLELSGTKVTAEEGDEPHSIKVTIETRDPALIAAAAEQTKMVTVGGKSVGRGMLTSYVHLDDSPFFPIEAVRDEKWRREEKKRRKEERRSKAK